ncbi:unnamed protein product, partial [Rotaria sordida]
MPTSTTTDINSSFDHDAVQQSNNKQNSINDVVAFTNHDCKAIIGASHMIA